MKDAPSFYNRRRLVMAVLLGTALSALGSGSGMAAEAGPETLQAVADMSRYCTACWRNARVPPDRWGDCTQEVFARLLERLSPDAWDRVLRCEGEERREFLRAIDTVKKRTQRSRKWAAYPDDSVADRHDLHERQLAEEREAVWQAAEELLSARQQRILQWSCEGWSIQEMAEELRISADRVSDEKYKAIRKLRRHLGSEA